MRQCWRTYKCTCFFLIKTSCCSKIFFFFCISGLPFLYLWNAWQARLNHLVGHVLPPSGLKDVFLWQSSQTETSQKTLTVSKVWGMVYYTIYCIQCQMMSIPCDVKLLCQQKNEQFGFTSLLFLTPLLPLTLPRFLCQLVFLFPSLLVYYPPLLVAHPPPFPLSPPPTPARRPKLLFVHTTVAGSSWNSSRLCANLIFKIDLQIKGGCEPEPASFCWCLEARGYFPPWLNSSQSPISGLLYSVQLDKPLNSAVPSAPQPCPLFTVGLYLCSLHGLHNIAGTQKTMEA